jgi:hypothetical protein
MGHMGRPRGIESIDDQDVREALAFLDERDFLITRESVATIVGLTWHGLRAYHRRRGLSWVEFVADIRATSVPPLGYHGPNDPDMRSIMVPLAPDLAEALSRVALAEERPARSQAIVLIREALIRRGALPSRQPQRIIRSGTDAA